MSSEQAKQWSPKIHLIIANLKRLVLGTFRGVSGPHLQDYTDDEFVYCFNRRYREAQLP